MPDCASGNIPARLCTVEDAVQGIVLGAGHPAMSIAVSGGTTFTLNPITQVLTVPTIPAAPVIPPADVKVMADATFRNATAPDYLGQVGIQVTDATNGNYSIWIATSTGVGAWTLKVGSLGIQNVAAVAITGGTITGITDISVADGGTGASTAAAARVNLRNATLAPVANNIDWALSDNFAVTLGASVTITFSNVQDGQSVMFAVTTPGAYSVTWPGVVEWPNSVTPTASGAGFTDLYAFTRINGVIYGNVVKSYTI
jgi:hypothetical protein